MHIAVLLYGLTAILGKLISIDAMAIVWWRVLITSISLIFLVRVFSLLKRIRLSDLRKYFMVGILIAMHWVTFFWAIQLSNASIGLVTLATQSLFTALLEPLAFRRKPRLFEVTLGALMIPAMLLIVKEVDTSFHMGIWVGLLSAFLVAAFTTWNKTMVDKANPLDISFIELGSAWLAITLLLPFVSGTDAARGFVPVGLDWLYLIILAILCTTVAFVLALRALRNLSAFTTNLIANLEPVYGILLAVLFLKEHHELTPGFYIGALLILLIIFAQPLIAKFRSSRYGRAPIQ